MQLKLQYNLTTNAKSTHILYEAVDINRIFYGGAILYIHIF